MALSVIAVPVAARAQAPASSPAKDDWGVWTSLAVGSGSDNGYPLGAANLAEWVTHGPFAASVRWAGTFDLESGGTSDGSLLLGVHPIRGSNVNGVIAIGAGLSRGDDGPNSPSQKPVMALGGQLIFNLAIPSRYRLRDAALSSRARRASAAPRMTAFGPLSIF